MRFRVLPVLVITVFIVSCIITIAILMHKQVTGEMLKRYQREHLVSVSQQSARLYDRLTHIANDLTTLSSRDRVMGFNEKKIRPLLLDFYNRHSLFVVAGYLMNRQGILTYVEGKDRSGEGYDISEQDHVIKLFATRKTVISGSFKAVEGYYAIAIHAPILTSGTLKGSTATLVKWKAFGQWFKKARISPNSFTMLLDRENRIIYHPDSNYTGQTLKETPKITLNGAGLDHDFLFKSNTALLGGPFFNNKQYMVACNPFSIKGSTYSIVSCAPHQEVLGPLMRMTTLTGLLTGLSLFVIAAGLGYFFHLFHQDKKQWLSFQKKLEADIANRKQTEQALKTSQETLLTVLDSVDATIYVSDLTSYKVLFMNQHMIDCFGSDLKGKICYEVFRNETSPCHLCTNHRLLDDNGRPSGVQIWSSLNPVVNRWYANYDRAIKWIDGRYVRIQISTDITHIKQLEKERRKIESQLQRAQKMEMIGTLAGGVAHDLNNVLSGIVSYPEFLLMELPEESPLRKPIQTIQESGQKAADIVHDLLTLTRRGVVSTQIIQINTVILEYLNSPEHKKLAEHHSGIRIETDLKEDLEPLKGSKVHLRKTIMNLISNAAEAQPGGGTITITTRSQHIDFTLKGYKETIPGSYGVLTIKDDGIGISPEDQDRIFEPFYTKKKMGLSGTGLGMAVVWGTVQDHKGYITIDSSEGRGATFNLYFPATQEIPESDAAIIPIDQYIGNGETILIIDDIKEQLDIAATILKKLNYRVNTVSSGETAVEYLKEKRADLLVLDMIMDPGMDGLDTYKKILKNNPSQKAIIASGFSETDRARELQNLGADNYIKKPYSLEGIGVAVKKALVS